MTVRPRHIPVLLARTSALLAPAIADRPAVLVDATLGLGGHTEALLSTHPELTVIGLDRDTQALRLAGERLAPFGDRLRPVHAVYDELPRVLDELGHDTVDAVLFDLGVSSMQLDEADRGFAYARNAPLDMRMDATTGHTAADVLNTYSVKDLARVLRDYGEERFAGRIAAAVAREREREPFRDSARLVELLYASVPAAARRTGGHPAKRTFQALRIEVNAELAVLQRAIPAAMDAVGVDGRVVVMAYQSLEDKVVKREFTARSTSRTPPGLPVELPGHGPEFELLTRGGEQADEAEVETNPRAASARLRAVRRIEKGNGRKRTDVREVRR